MCGIAGIFHRDVGARADLFLAKRMTDRLVHRGPDDGGVVGLGPVALGHRRLSIIDLSPAGHQPMGSADERYWITFNGEIYNFLEIRSTLEARGVQFRTRTDTEVLLALYREEGEACLERLNGMFAFAIYDRAEHTLFLARDRLGKKPLYVWDDGDRVLFGSELKALQADPSFGPDIDPAGLVDYLGMLYVPDPRTIYRGIFRVKPAHALTIRADRVRERRYWRVPYRPREAWSEEDRLGLERASEELEALLHDAVRIRMIADVPLGAFLSGGVDSSLVVSEMSRVSSLPIKTSTVGFSEREEDESGYAEAVAERFGCAHHTEPVEADAASMVETLVWHFDEPFADSSSLPTYLLSQVTRRHVTVALSGDGGDEAFGGYEKYTMELRERRLRALMPRAGWRWLADAAGWWLTGAGNRYGLARDMGGGGCCAFIPRADACWGGGEDILNRRGFFAPDRGTKERGVNVLRTLAEDPGTAYFRTQSFIPPEALPALLSSELVSSLEGYDARSVVRDAYRDTGETDGLSAVQGTDLATSLPGDMLTKVDRMSMAHALEVRCPLLDHRVVEFAFRLPPVFRLYRGEGKRILKRVLESRLPRAWIDRPKHGFTIPSDRWFRGPLAPLAGSVILEGGLRTSGLLDMRTVEVLLQSHRRGRGNFGTLLWSLLALGIWYDRIRPGAEARWVPGAAPTRVVDRGPYRR